MILERGVQKQWPVLQGWLHPGSKPPLPHMGGAGGADCTAEAAAVGNFPTSRKQVRIFPSLPSVLSAMFPPLPSHSPFPWPLLPLSPADLLVVGKGSRVVLAQFQLGCTWIHAQLETAAVVTTTGNFPSPIPTLGLAGNNKETGQGGWSWALLGGWLEQGRNSSGALLTPLPHTSAGDSGSCSSR